MDRIPFNAAEIEDATFAPGPFGVPIKQYKTPITSKENVRMVYERKLPFWMPLMSDVLSLGPRIDPDNIARVFCFEANPLTNEEKEKIATDGYEDKFGVKWIYVPQAMGSMVRPGAPALLNANDWKSVIPFPDIDKWDWEGTKASNAEYVNTDKFIRATIMSGFFERLISWMDFEGAAVAMVDEDQKGAVHEIFDALADLYIKMIDKYIWAYGVDIINLHDDWGSERAPFFSLATVREMIVPYLKKVVDYCHSRCVFIDLHSCGKVEPLIPACIEAGLDSWSGQKINDKAMVVDKYGDKLILSVESELAVMMGQPRKEVGPHENKEAAMRIIKQYCGAQYAQKQVTFFEPMAPEELTDTLYEESRKAFCPGTAAATV